MPLTFRQESSPLSLLVSFPSFHGGKLEFSDSHQGNHSAPKAKDGYVGWILSCSVVWLTQLKKKDYILKNIRVSDEKNTILTKEEYSLDIDPVYRL